MSKAYPSSQSMRWMTLNQVAAEIDRTPRETSRLLKKVAYLGVRRRIGQPHRYPAAAVEVLKAMLDIPHRPIPSSEPDWLSRYEGENR